MTVVAHLRGVFSLISKSQSLPEHSSFTKTVKLLPKKAWCHLIPGFCLIQALTPSSSEMNDVFLHLYFAIQLRQNLSFSRAYPSNWQDPSFKVGSLWDCLQDPAMTAERLLELIDMTQVDGDSASQLRIFDATVKQLAEVDTNPFGAQRSQLCVYDTWL